MKLKPNFNLSKGLYSIIKFPSGEIQIMLTDIKLTNTSSKTITITGSILSSDNLIELLQLVEALRYEQPNIELQLVMPYCAYSRQDRRCNSGESFSLKVFTDLINLCKFTSVTTYDNHSDVSTALLHNCKNIHIKTLLHRYAYLTDFYKPKEHLATIYDFFISPDAGANKKVFSCSQQFDIPMIRADKHRNINTGQITFTEVFTTSEELKDKTVLIIDDICQGGRTFEELAKAIKAIEPACDIHLYVTHGFFNNGFNHMKEAGISKFICTNSVPQVHTCNELTVIAL